MSGKDFWGPAFWKTIHSMAASYTPKQKKAFEEFMYGLIVLLPCDACRDHLRQNLKTLPMENYMIDNHSLFLWSYYLHDIVNRQLGKTSPPFTLVKEAYFKGLGSECTQCKLK